MVINANVILLMAAVLLALFAVMQLPKLFVLLKGEPKEASAAPAQPVKTVAVYQSEKAPKKAVRKAAGKKVSRPRKKTAKKTTKKSAGRPATRSRKKAV